MPLLASKSWEGCFREVWLRAGETVPLLSGGLPSWGFLRSHTSRALQAPPGSSVPSGSWEEWGQVEAEARPRPTDPGEFSQTMDLSF